MDLIGLEKGITRLNEETIPALVAAVNQLGDKADTMKALPLSSMKPTGCLTGLMA
jgi:hypothetical protein